jgi:hypothetical protein
MSDNNCDEAKTNILYVVFHGELAFYDTWDSDCIRVYAPVVYANATAPSASQIASGTTPPFIPPVLSHTYMAGRWLGEREIPRGSTLQLNGVVAGRATISQSKIVRLGQNSEPRPASAYFEIRLPRPHEILDGYIIDCAGAIVINDAPSAVQEMDLRPVFKYRMKEDYAWLTDLDNCPDHDPLRNWGAGIGIPGYYSLHIFAEEDDLFSDPDESHARNAFATAGHVLGVNQLFVNPRGTLKGAGSYPGLNPLEVSLTLAQRTQGLAFLGQQLRQGHKHLVWGYDESFTTEDGMRFVSGTHSSCGPVGN